MKKNEFNQLDLLMGGGPGTWYGLGCSGVVLLAVGSSLLTVGATSILAGLAITSCLMGAAYNTPV